ncbi:hypothetical protein TWF679_004001 [Orbilia oligospora]|uniref:Uncharacterized protein n=1 Tax=Orbilia oligospora TaxID=2813651 RepID=A0A8H8VEN3_ORBOL|nr:hypothetical protein TWF679_004001 [Orbilia oligospora]
MEVAGGVEPTEKQVNPGKNLLKEEGKENNRADGCSACMALEDRLLGSMHSGGGRAVKNDFGLVRRSARLKEEHPSQASFVPGCEIGSCVVASSCDLLRSQRMVFRGCGGTKVIVWRGLSPSAFVLKPNFSTPTSKLHPKAISRYCYWPGHWLWWLAREQA